MMSTLFYDALFDPKIKNIRIRTSEYPRKGRGRLKGVADFKRNELILLFSHK